MLRNAGVKCFTIGVCYVTITWQQIFEVALTVVGQCCQPCGFPANLGLFFCGFAFFLKTCGLLALIKICLFFRIFLQISVLRIAFLSNFMAILLFQFTTKRNLGVILCKFAHFGFVFLDMPPCFSN